MAKTGTQTKSVEYTDQNVSLCMCGQCPVQGPSSCAADLYSKIEPMRAEHKLPENGKEVPGLYCGTGTSACNDLEAQQRCSCPTCQVWKEHDLTNYKYCLNGSAEQIG